LAGSEQGEGGGVNCGLVISGAREA
jgi:hypothetical protein